MDKPKVTEAAVGTEQVVRELVDALKSLQKNRRRSVPRRLTNKSSKILPNRAAVRRQPRFLGLCRAFQMSTNRSQNKSRNSKPPRIHRPQASKFNLASTEPFKDFAAAMESSSASS